MGKVRIVREGAKKIKSEQKMRGDWEEEVRLIFSLAFLRVFPNYSRFPHDLNVWNRLLSVQRYVKTSVSCFVLKLIKEAISCSLCNRSAFESNAQSIVLVLHSWTVFTELLIESDFN